MKKTINRMDFLNKYGIEDQFNQSGLDWEQLMCIVEHFDNTRSDYEKIASDYVKVISGFSHIHSVKYRIKRVDSLLEKIITKRYDYLNDIEPINEKNYMKHITDLIGIRIIYLFKSDYLEIHNQLMKKYFDFLVQDVHIYLKDGDDPKIYKDIKKPVFEVNDFYRSIHYTLRATNDRDSPRIEIQTRTIFEEAWGEINHELVYKNRNSSEYLFLIQASQILSSLTGECDRFSSLMKDVNNNYIKKLSEQITTERVMQEVMNDFLHKKI